VSSPWWTCCAAGRSARESLCVSVTAFPIVVVLVVVVTVVVCGHVRVGAVAPPALVAALLLSCAPFHLLVYFVLEPSGGSNASG